MRREMTVQRKIHRASNIHPNAGIKHGGLFRIEHFSRNAHRVGLLRHFPFFLKRVTGLAQHQQTLFHQAEIAIRQCGEFLEAFPARQR